MDSNETLEALKINPEDLKENFFQLTTERCFYATNEA
jgi:hypothetical protein